MEGEPRKMDEEQGKSSELTREFFCIFWKVREGDSLIVTLSLELRKHSETLATCLRSHNPAVLLTADMQ